MRIWVLVLAVTLSGCASWRNTPASCDGAERRVMNKGQWDEQMGLGGCRAPVVKWGRA